MASVVDARRTIIKSLEADATIQSLVPFTGYAGLYKVFGGKYVHESIPHPYIMVSYFSGGHDYRSLSPSLDMLMLVLGEVKLAADELQSGVSDDIQVAINAALHLKIPTLPTDLLSTLQVRSMITEMYPFEEKYSRQNVHFLQRGAVYRIKIDPSGS